MRAKWLSTRDVRVFALGPCLITPKTAAGASQWENCFVAKILLVEDTDTVRLALSTLLKRDGHSVIEACDGGDAIRVLQNTQFDIVVTDMYMPGVDGVELIRHLREFHPVVKICAISGGGVYGLTKVAIGVATELGADMIMPKPIDNEVFLATIGTLTQGAM